ncbi:hypothetical protein [Alkalinema sp. FACHB-956]|uniref:hypothetical protein n=1 Tax=Alkalinema sp. FACHB-956 TaxID=2692768 RepID=UPI0016890421|nr:hypothetical protein [Alkalinema sp. FACHB-956]MBD2328156.1 hypothetical protein [Alkalinema sp. FACHB-956]
MGLDIGLLLEYYDTDGWQPALHVADRVKNPRTHLGLLEVCSWSWRQSPTSIFFGDDPIIPFNLGLPTDLSARVWEAVHLNFEDDDEYAGWIALPDLYLSEWSEQMVLVEGWVEPQYAHLFGDGYQPAPIAQLKAMGTHGYHLAQTLQWCRRAKTPAAFAEYQKHGLQPYESRLRVTWLEPLIEFVRRIWDEGLSGLVELEFPERYRLITTVG